MPRYPETMQEAMFPRVPRAERAVGVHALVEHVLVGPQLLSNAEEGILRIK